MKKLDFSDVLIEPGISLKPLTRGMVNITPNDYVPIIIANMVTTGTFDAAEIASPSGDSSAPLILRYSVSKAGYVVSYLHPPRLSCISTPRVGSLPSPFRYQSNQ